MSPVTQRTHAQVLPAAILIAGPTASGKSGLALALARDFDGVVINTDSMQVYADLRRLSARPSASEAYSSAPAITRQSTMVCWLAGLPHST